MQANENIFPAAEKTMESAAVRSDAGFLRRLVGVVLLLNLVYWGTVIWILHGSKEQSEQRAKENSENISKAVSRSLANELYKVDTLVLFARDEIKRQMTSGGIAPSRLNAYLSHVKSRLPELNAVRVTDAKGVIRYGSGIDPTSPVSIENDEHFTFLRDHPDAGAIISKPKYGKISRKWVIIIARAYHDGDGAFAGVVSGILDLDHLPNAFRHLDIGPNGFINVHNRDFALLASRSRTGDGKLIGDRTAFPEIQAMIEAGAEGGTFSTVSSPYGMKHKVSFGKPENWPLYVSVGLSSDDYLSVWRAAARKGAAISGIVSLMSVLVAYVIYRYRRKRLLFIDTLKNNQDMFRDLAEMSSDWIWEQDRDFKITHVVGNAADKPVPNGVFLIGRTHWDSALDANDPNWAKHRTMLEAHLPFKDFEYDCLDNDGNKHTFLVSGKPVFDSAGDFKGYRGVTKDITERKTYEERIRHLAQHDSLTLLPNRLLFYDRVGQAIRSARRKESKCALLYLDLDRFKSVNDRYGHGVGDRLLVDVASRLQAQLRESDTLSRLGGDEFALVMPEVESVRDIRTVAQMLIDAMVAPFILVDVPESLNIGLSIGIAVFPEDGDSVEELVRAADEAMYRVKNDGNALCFYSPEDTIDGTLT